MADITMCKGEGCEAKATCHRFTAEPNEHRQSYFMESPIVNEGCEYYINHNNYLKKITNIIRGPKDNIIN